MEVLVTNSNPDSQLHFVRKFAKDLAVLFALHLAETISSLFRHVLDHPSKVLYDSETEPCIYKHPHPLDMARYRCHRFCKLIGRLG